MSTTKPQVVVQIEANLTWEAAPDESTGAWIGVCRPLNLNAIGDTWADMQECANEAMMLLFRSLFRQGELPAFLQQHGWKQLGGPSRANGVEPRFDIPADWKRRSRYDELVTN